MKIITKFVGSSLIMMGLIGSLLGGSAITLRNIERGMENKREKSREALYTIQDLKTALSDEVILLHDFILLNRSSLEMSKYQQAKSKFLADLDELELLITPTDKLDIIRRRHGKIARLAQELEEKPTSLPQIQQDIRAINSFRNDIELYLEAVANKIKQQDYLVLEQKNFWKNVILAVELSVIGLVLLALLIQFHLIVVPVICSLQELQKGAIAIGYGNLNYRLAINTKDEIEQVGEKFNQMAIKLTNLYDSLEQKIKDQKQAEIALKKLNEELENIVNERTAKLNNTVQKLQKEVRNRVRAQRALSKSEKRLTQLANNLPGMIYEFCLAPDGKMFFPYISSGVRNLMGLEPEQIKLDATPAFNCIHPDDILSLKNIILDSATTLNTIEHELRITNGADENIWVRFNAKPENQSDGGITWYGCMIDISDRKLAEAKLVKQEQFLSSVYDGSEHLIFVVEVTEDGDFRSAGWNTATEKITGISRQEIIGKVPEDYHGMVEGTAVRQRYQQCVQAGKSITYEECLTFQDQETHWFTTINPLQDSEGRIHRLVGTTVNINALKEAEAILVKQEQFLSSVYNGSEHVIFVIDVTEDGNFYNVSWNLVAQKTSGLKLEDIVGKTPEEIHGEIEGLAIRQSFQQCVEAREAITYEQCLTFQDQETHWFTTLNPLQNSEGKIYRLVGTTVNITARKQAENKLAQQLKMAAFRGDVDRAITRNNYLETMLNHCTEAMVKHLDAAFARIWILNPQENILELQASAGLYTHIDGAHSHVPVGKFKIGLIAQEKLPYLTNNILEDPQVSNKEWAKKEGMMAFAGYPLMVQDELLGVVAMFARQPLPDSILQALCFAADEIALAIKRHQAEAQLRQQKQQLEATLMELHQTQSQLIQSEKMSSLGQMVAGIAHEINNPVNFIHGNLTHAKEYSQDLLGLVELYQQEYPQPTPEIEAELEAIELDFLVKDFYQLLDSMKLGSQRIREIVKSLRTFSRLDEAEVKEVDIHEGIDSTLMILHNRLKATPKRQAIEVIKDYGNLPLVECYSGQLNQVFMNLISNGIDAIEESLVNKQGQIKINTAVESANWIIVKISDNGIGIPEKVKDKLFDPFFTTKPVGKGTGLGLSISYQIVVDRHHGELFCQSEIGEGTQFMIKIPLRQ